MATLTDPNIEVIVDQHLILWARARNWDDFRPVAGSKTISVSYEDTFQTPLATVVVSQLELAEAFLDQRDEGQAPLQMEEFEDMEDESGAIRAHEAPSIKNRPDPKKS